MDIHKPEVIFVKSSGVPKESHSRNRRLRKKLKVDEYAEHFIDVRFHMPEELTTDQLDIILNNKFVDSYIMSGSDILISMSADTTLMEFYITLFSNFEELIINHVRNRVGMIAEILGNMTGYRYSSRIASIHMGDATYATDDYYNCEGDYA